MWVERGDLCVSCSPCMVMQTVLCLDVSPPAWKNQVHKCPTHTRMCARAHAQTRTRLVFSHSTCKVLCDWLILRVAGA